MTKKIFEADFKAEQVIKFLEDAAKQVKDIRPLMKVAAHFMKSTVDENFETEGQHTGDKWKEWSTNWKKQRLKEKHGEGGILQFRGDLRRSLRSKYDDTSAMAIVSGDYAAAHNFGFKGKVNKTSSKGKRFTCNMNMPKREFMRINEREQEYLIADLTVKLKEMFMNNG